MKEYQNCDYRSIYTAPVDVPGAGPCWLVLFSEPTNETNADRPEGETWTALFLVSPELAGPAVVKDCLEATVGYKGEPTPEEAAVALAEFGKRIDVVENTGMNGDHDLRAMRATAANLLAVPALLRGSRIADFYRRKCSVCGEPTDAQLDARIVHAKRIYPNAKYCPHCGQYPASINPST